MFADLMAAAPGVPPHLIYSGDLTYRIDSGFDAEGVFKGIRDRFVT